MIKDLINKILGSSGYKCIKIKNTVKLVPEKKIDRFSLDTGERQVAISLEDIRRDHVVRYEKASEFLLNNHKSTSNLFGGDIFCGNGYGSNIIAKNTNCLTIGIDASSEAIDLANEYYANDKMFFVVKKFPFTLPENIFDFIISFETIEHVIEDKGLVDEFSRSLKSGGYLFLSAPNEEICSFEKNNYEFHVKHYRFEEIVNLLISTNQFELITWYGNGAYDFEDGTIVNYNKREENEMEMKEKEFDSHLTYIFKKK
jgi:SAM-dependent methyltransferase